MSQIGFKDIKTLRGMFTASWHPILIALFLWITVRYSKDKIIITSAFRKDDPGVHGQIPLRGFDLRSSVFTKPQEIADSINQSWIYDLDRPEMKVALFHDIGQGEHLHFQVHPKTRFLGKLDVSNY